MKLRTKSDIGLELLTVNNTNIAAVKGNGSDEVAS